MPGLCSFNDIWLEQEKYKEWLQKDKLCKRKAFCTLCKKTINLASMGEGALTSHAKGVMNGFSTEEDSRSGGHDQICCLIESGDRCTRHAGNASYSKRIQKTVQQRKLRLTRDDSVNHIYICDHHKNMIQSVRIKRKRKDSEDGSGSPDGEEEMPEIDFFQMPVNTLRRYKRHFKLPARPGMNKAQLADTVARHFKTIPVVEKEALTFFIYMAKNFKSRFDQKHIDSMTS